MPALSRAARWCLAIETTLVGGVFGLLVVLGLTRFQSTTDGHAFPHGGALLVASLPVKVLFVLLLRVVISGRPPKARVRGVPLSVAVAVLSALLALLALQTIGAEVAGAGRRGALIAAVAAALGLPAVHLAWCCAGPRGD